MGSIIGLMASVVSIALYLALIVIIFVSFFLFLLYNFEGHLKWYHRIVGVIFAVTCMYGLFSCTASMKKVDCYRIEETQELRAIRLRASEEGSMFLAIGSWEEQFHYIYYVDSPSGTILQKLKAINGGVFVKEIVVGQPRLVIEQDQKSVLSWFQQGFGTYCENGQGTTYTFYVPPGSIQRTYDLDVALQTGGN